MKVIIAAALLIATTNSFADEGTEKIDAAQTRVNQALQAARLAANGNDSITIEDAQNIWLKSADLDCKYLTGQPKKSDISVTGNPAFGACMADNMQSRANVLLNLACQKNRAYCQK